MNTILTVILIALIAVALIGVVFVFAVAIAAVKKLAQIRKEKKQIVLLRKQLETAVHEVAALQQHVIDQAVTIAAKEMTDFIESLNKDE